MQSLAAEYRELRKIKGHYAGGEYVESVDKFGGRKHEVMAQLGTSLGDGSFTEAQVVELMGPPDQFAEPGNPWWSLIRNSEGSERALLYYWRGGHDLLYFRVHAGKVIGSDWWMAYE